MTTQKKIQCDYIKGIIVMCFHLQRGERAFGAQGGGVEQWVELRVPLPSLVFV